MSIRVRGGLEANFDKSKMTGRELAITTDTKKAFITFAPNDVQQLSTVEMMNDYVDLKTQDIVDTLTTEVEAAASNAISTAQNLQTTYAPRLQNVEYATVKTDIALKDLAEASKSVIPDVKVSTYSRSSVLSSNAREGQMNVKVSGNAIKNEVTNGNFANSYTYWSASGGTISVLNNVLTFLPSIQYAVALHTISLKIGNKYYVSANIKSTSTSVKLFLTDVGQISSGGINTYERKSFVGTSTGSGSSIGVQDGRASGWDNIYIKDVICIDMGSDASNPLYNKTTAEMDAMTPYYLDGFSDVKAGVVRTVGKNQFDGNIEPGWINDSGSEITSATEWRTKKYIPVKPNTTYVHSYNGVVAVTNIVEYDINKVFIRRIATASITTTAITAYVRYHSGALDANKQGSQFELGSTVTTYEPYTSTVKYLPYASLKSVPNGVKDYIDGSRYVKNVSDAYNLQASDIATLYTGFSNVDLVQTNTPFKSNIKVGNASAATGQIVVGNMQETYSDVKNNASNAGKYYLHSDGTLVFVVAKGTYANLAAAQTALAGTKIIYQLATPIITEILPNTVKSSPNGSVQYLNIRGEVGYYGTNIAVTNSALPIKSLTSVKKISIADGSETSIDLATCTIASGGLTFTSTALVAGDLVDWNYEFDSALSTTPLIEYEYNNNTFIQESWTTPTLLNSWVAVDTPRTPKFKKTSIGEVKLCGMIKSGTVGAIAFTLPMGYRPAYGKYFSVSSNNAFGSVNIDSSGNVNIVVGNNTWVSLEGISFFTD